MSHITKTLHHSCEVLIIGAGGSGLTAAIHAKNAGMDVVVVSKVHPIHSHTAAAQGGINASINCPWEWHMYDTIKGSDWLSDQDAVEILCKNASDAIYNLEEWGVYFDRNIDGTIAQKTYGGQTTFFGQGPLARRVCSVADDTGHAIMNNLYATSTKSGVRYFNYHFAIELLFNNDVCCGVMTIDIESGILNIISSPNVIVATGGYSQIYQTSTSSNICTGDGNGLIFRAGLPLQDMEFVQFHPTAIHKLGILITEAARSSGAMLVNRLGERFMTKYAPNLMELACRDVVARAIATEIAIGNGCGNDKDHMLLDLSNVSEEYMRQHLPNMLENCKSFINLDPAKDPIPVAPAAHYTMGGIPTNSSCQVVDIDKHGNIKIVNGLYAIGEAACISVHGANRLGCNSLLELIVFGKIVIEKILSSRDQNNAFTHKGNIRDDLQLFQTHSSKNSCKQEISILKDKLKDITQKHIGLFRSKDSLQCGIYLLRQLRRDFKNIQITNSNSSSWCDEIIEYVTFDNLLISSEVTAYASLMREESRGAHYRQDFCVRDDDHFLHHSLIKKDTTGDGEFMYHKRKTRMNKRGHKSFLPDFRKY